MWQLQSLSCDPLRFFTYWVINNLVYLFLDSSTISFDVLENKFNLGPTQENWGENNFKNVAKPNRYNAPNFLNLISDVTHACIIHYAEDA